MGKKSGMAKPKKNDKARPGKPKLPELEENNVQIKDQVKGTKKGMGAFLHLVKPQREVKENKGELKEERKTLKEKKPVASSRAVKKANKEPFYRVGYRFLQNVLSELKKVSWPKRTEILVHTMVVLGSVLFVALLIWVADIILGQALELLI